MDIVLHIAINLKYQGWIFKIKYYFKNSQYFKNQLLYVTKGIKYR